MLNVRLDKETEKKLNYYVEDQDITKSQVVKEALVQYLSREEMATNPYALGEDLFGMVGSDESEHSSTYKSKLKDKLREKYNR